MADSLRRVPILGNYIEFFAGDSYHRKLKNSLRRGCYSAAIALTVLGTVASGIGGAIAANITNLVLGNVANDSWDAIDSWIDTLSSEDCRLIYSFLERSLVDFLDLSP